MATQNDFTAEEWTAVSELPGLVMAGAVFADGRKIVSSVREMVAASGALKTGAEQFPTNELLQSLVTASGKTNFSLPATESKSVADAVGVIGNRIDDAVLILRAKTSDQEFTEISTVLQGAALAAAERTGSGTLGFGGEKIDAGEQAFLDRLTAIFATGGHTPSADA